MAALPLFVCVRTDGKGVDHEFIVRRQKVADALAWLKEHNPFYAAIHIDPQALDALPADGNVDQHVRRILVADDDAEDEGVVVAAAVAASQRDGTAPMDVVPPTTGPDAMDDVGGGWGDSDEDDDDVPQPDPDDDPGVDYDAEDMHEAFDDAMDILAAVGAAAPDDASDDDNPQDLFGRHAADDGMADDDPDMLGDDKGLSTFIPGVVLQGDGQTDDDLLVHGFRVADALHHDVDVPDIYGADDDAVMADGVAAAAAPPGSPNADAAPPASAPLPRVAAPKTGGVLSDLSTPDLAARCFPHLFPYGTGDFTTTQGLRRADKKSKHPLASVSPAEQVEHLMRYEDGRFIRDERFVFWWLNWHRKNESVSKGQLSYKAGLKVRYVPAPTP